MKGSVFPADLYVQLIRFYCDSKSALFLSNTCTRLRCTLSEIERTKLIMGVSLWNKSFEAYKINDFMKCPLCGELVLSKNLKHRHSCRVVKLESKSCLRCCVVYSKRTGYHESGNCTYRSKKGPFKTCNDCGETIVDVKYHSCYILGRRTCKTCGNPYAYYSNCGICSKKLKFLEKIAKYPLKLISEIIPKDNYSHRPKKLIPFIAYSFKENVTLVVHGYGNYECIGTHLQCCGWCIRISMPNAVRCETCGCALYCSEQCQDDDWQFHKHNCLD